MDKGGGQCTSVRWLNNGGDMMGQEASGQCPVSNKYNQLTTWGAIDKMGCNQSNGVQLDEWVQFD